MTQIQRLIPDSFSSAPQHEPTLFVDSREQDSLSDPIPAGPISRFVVRVGDRAYMLRAPDVDWIGAARNYVVLHAEKKEYRLRATLQSLCERLDPRLFRRIHKSTIVNLDRIREIQPWFGGDYVVFLRDGTNLRASRSHARALLRPMQ